MGEDVYRGAERRDITPPALPIRVVGEGVQAEHPRAHDLGTDAVEERRRVSIVDTGRSGAARVTEDLRAEGAGRRVRGRETAPVLTHGVLGRRCRVVGRVAVQRREEGHANAGHVSSP